MVHFPRAHQVSVAWLKSLPGVPSTVGTSLPAEQASWSEFGFVQVSVVGGSPATDSPLYSPVLQLDCWGNNLNSIKPPWGRTEALASLIVYRCYDVDNMEKEIVLPADFHNARLLTANVLTEPRRITERADANSDSQGYARVQFDVQFTWTVKVAT